MRPTSTAGSILERLILVSSKITGCGTPGSRWTLPGINVIIVIDRWSTVSPELVYLGVRRNALFGIAAYSSWGRRRNVLRDRATVLAYRIAGGRSTERPQHHRLKQPEQRAWGRCNIIIWSPGTPSSPGVAPAWRNHVFCRSTSSLLYTGLEKMR